MSTLERIRGWNLDPRLEELLELLAITGLALVTAILLPFWLVAMTGRVLVSTIRKVVQR